MIRYALACRQGHAFESWFQNSNAFDDQAKRKLIACPECGSTAVEKALMAPRLSQAVTGSRRRVAQGPEDSAAPPPASPSSKAPVAIMSPQERELRSKLKELREQLTSSAEHVGPRFPKEARKMHYGETEHRSIYGEASADEARALIDEGIEFHPLPVLPDEHN
ncbi:MAG: DUF1178 family protein [Rhodoplanes sp.]|jgi:hypothetical protein